MISTNDKRFAQAVARGMRNAHPTTWSRYTGVAVDLTMPLQQWQYTRDRLAGALQNDIPGFNWDAFIRRCEP